MLAWQRHLLSQIPDFYWDPLEEQWGRACAQLAEFLENENRMPRYRSTVDSERALAAWVHKQRHLHRRGVLAAHRVTALRAMPFRILVAHHPEAPGAFPSGELKGLPSSTAE